MIIKLQRAKWDRWAIDAELRRKGHTAKSMAVESGLSTSTIRAALVKPSINANRLISRLLGVPLHELWPDWFDADGELFPAKLRRKLSRMRGDSASHESRVA